mgnify:CR=1 FL=1
MKYSKIKLDKLSIVVRTFNDQGFNYPDNYKLSFPVFQFCRYCKRPFLTKKIHVFESSESGKIICTCTKCGGRHNLTIKNLQETKKAYKVIAICVALLFVLIPLLFY